MKRATRGFTLVEVMVALAIVGMALPALLSRVQGTLDDLSYMHQKTYAHWFVENKTEELKMTQLLQGTVIKNKKQQDREEFSGIEWFWKAEVKETEVPTMFRLEVSVGIEEDKPLATLSSFLYDQQ